ncbi:MAG: hypothetical protein IT259_14165 [Saprospiraceae bacterium]|nr:hypothetical protein [Saprospiraceae bacterium]
MTRTLFFFLLLALAIGACKKADLPDDVEETPVFRVDYGTDNNSESVVAGVDGRYLFTSFNRDDNDVVTMRGAFAHADCPDANCPNTLIFEFRHTQPGAVEPIDSGAVIQPGLYGADRFRRPASDSSGTYLARVTFEVDAPEPGSSYLWSIQQAPQLVVESGAPSFSYTFNDITAPLKIALNYIKSNGFIGYTEFAYRFDQGACPQVNILTAPDSVFPGSVRMVAEMTPASGNYNFLWNNGLTDQTITIDSADFGGIKSVTVTDDAGCTSVGSTFGIDTGQDVNRVPNVVLSRQDSLVVNTLQLGTVAIIWRQPETGEEWRSDAGFQPATSFMEVYGSAPYELNEKGQKTNRMNVNFKCRLFNESGESIPFQGTGTIALAYP